MPNPGLAELTQEINDTIGVEQSAVLALNGVAAKIQAAVDAALANGATATELQPVIDLGVQLKAQSDALAAAVAANP